MRMGSMIQKPLERVMIFIDGGYLRKLFTDLFGNDNISFFKMRRTLLKSYNDSPTNFFRANLIRMYYYDGAADEEPERTQHKKYFDSLKKRFVFLTVRLGEAVKLSNGRFRQKGVDVLMAIDALTMGYRDYYDSGIFFLGDRDFIPLIEAVKSVGKKTYGFHYMKKVPPELIYAFDFRRGFNKTTLKRWHITSEEFNQNQK